MADGTRSLFESGDGLEQALHANRQIARAEAAKFDHLIGYLLEWCDDPVATASCAAAGERVWQYGGSGTPEIPEFGVCEVASALVMSPNGAGIFVGDILDIRYRLPRLDAALHRGQVDAWRVRKVASATRWRGYDHIAEDGPTSSPQEPPPDSTSTADSTAGPTRLGGHRHACTSRTRPRHVYGHDGGSAPQGRAGAG